jgi:O-antigen ligase
VIPGLVAVKTSGVYLDKKIHRAVEGGYHAHNNYLQLAAEVGLVGIGLLFWFFFSGTLRKLPPKATTYAVQHEAYTRAFMLASYNKKFSFYLLVFLAISGLTSGYTLTSPSAAWPLYFSLARLVRQDMYLKSFLRGTHAQSI